MTCNQLRGACDVTFTANTFDEITEMSKKHGMEIFQKKDTTHLKTIRKIQTLMQDSNAMEKWLENKRNEFVVCRLTNS